MAHAKTAASIARASIGTGSALRRAFRHFCDGARTTGCSIRNVNGTVHSIWDRVQDQGVSNERCSTAIKIRRIRCAIRLLECYNHYSTARSRSCECSGLRGARYIGTTRRIGICTTTTARDCNLIADTEIVVFSSYGKLRCCNCIICKSNVFMADTGAAACAGFDFNARNCGVSLLKEDCRVRDRFQHCCEQNWSRPWTSTILPFPFREIANLRRTRGRDGIVVAQNGYPQISSAARSSTTSSQRVGVNNATARWSKE